MRLYRDNYRGTYRLGGGDPTLTEDFVEIPTGKELTKAREHVLDILNSIDGKLISINEQLILNTWYFHLFSKHVKERLLDEEKKVFNKLSKSEDELFPQILPEIPF